ncbi:MAG: signal recognition particle subunit SRP19/SEC65 family protein [Methanoregulaceae archaeon]|jgi:signal recognition particle subunit SRP19|nr:signal recognition particle subunit SRP19/SEC65 family protein [Methanoregulaceae archaeon]
MKEEMKGERILYPCYFNANLMRSQGRRITRSRAVKDPSLADIERAVKRCGVRYRTEQKSHPSFWWKREGRIVVTWGQGKEQLLKKVAGFLEVKR